MIKNIILIVVAAMFMGSTHPAQKKVAIVSVFLDKNLTGGLGEDIF